MFAKIGGRTKVGVHTSAQSVFLVARKGPPVGLAPAREGGGLEPTRGALYPSADSEHAMCFSFVGQKSKKKWQPTPCGPHGVLGALRR